MPWDSPQSLKVGSAAPLRFKSGTRGPPSKFKSGTPEPPSKFKSGTPKVRLHRPLMNFFFFFFKKFYLFFPICFSSSFLNNKHNIRPCQVSSALSGEFICRLRGMTYMRKVRNRKSRKILSFLLSYS